MFGDVMGWESGGYHFWLRGESFCQSWWGRRGFQIKKDRVAGVVVRTEAEHLSLGRANWGVEPEKWRREFGEVMK